MLKNYINIAFRSLLKNKGFSAINIFGLAIGLAVGLLIMMYVMDELSYDRYNKAADRIYRVDGDIKFGGTHYVLANAAAPMAAALKQDYPEVEEATRFRDYGGFLVRNGAQNIKENKVIYADASVFSVFSLPLVAGDPKTALQGPETVVISEKIARKYFNSTDVVGRILLINDKAHYKITGVMKEIPGQSHMNFDFFASLAGSSEAKSTDWLSNNFNTYILLRKDADPKKMEASLADVVNKYVSPQVRSALNTSIEDLEKSGNFLRYNLMPLTDIHLHSNKTGELGPNNSIQYVYIFSAIAIFILLIACVNFMNLSTARSSNRAKEVGIRKVMGSQRGQLMMQFITESILVSFMAMVLALGIAQLLLPFFNELAGKEMSLGLFSKPWLVPVLLALVVVVGLLAGSYPAFFLSAFRPVLVLKGTIASGFRTGLLRNILVVFQFSLSIFLIVGTMVIYNQLSYIRNKKIGFDRDQVVVLQNTRSLGKQAEVFKQDILSVNGVEGVTMTSFLPTSVNRNNEPLFLDATMNQERAVSMQTWTVDDQYVPVMGMQIVQGRNFSKNFPTDSQGIVINEAAARLLGFKDPINQVLYEPQGDLQNKQLSAYRILGVVKDFNFSSLREQVTPLALFLQENTGSISFRVKSDDLPKLISQVESKWKALVPNQPFNYSFMDDDFNTLYKSETRIGKISLSFSVLAIFIACLGLFGLAAYAAEQRTKEIGIRKVLGATAPNIVKLLSKDFLKLVLISILVAFPMGWWVMHRWLQDFAYRVAIGWEVFALAAFLAVLIALGTVSFHAIKAALNNPLKSLRAQ